jgi:hypothetical protein
MEEPDHKEVCVELPGAGASLRILRRNIEREAAEMDPHFFDSSYTLAGATGFTVWEGSWFLIHRLVAGLAAELAGRRVLELGSGTGITALAMAALGAHVLATDLPSVVHGILALNQRVNAAPDAQTASPSDTWSGAVRIAGRAGGTLACTPLDWTVPIDAQVSGGNDPRETDFIIACETVWLKELIAPFVDTTVALLSAPRHPRCLMAYRDRGKASSECFAVVGELVHAFAERGCEMRALVQGEAPEAPALYEIAIRNPEP